jgi:zinc-ribbon domain
MLCPHCGSEVSDDTRSCPKCGATLAIEAPILAATDVGRDMPQQEQQVRRLFGVVFLGAVCALGGWFLVRRAREGMPERKTESSPPASSVQRITPDSFSVDGGEYRSYALTTSADCGASRIQGNVLLLAPTSKATIEMLVFDNKNFELWKNKHPTTVLYRASGKRSSLAIVLPRSGQYFVVFHNQQRKDTAMLRSDISVACVR